MQKASKGIGVIKKILKSLPRNVLLIIYRSFIRPHQNLITDADYAHTKTVCKDFEIKNLGEYHDLYVQSDTLLLADVFEKFTNMCLEIHELDPATFSMASSSKKDQSKIRSFN